MPDVGLPGNLAELPVDEIITLFHSLPDDQFFNVPYETLITLPREAQEAIVLDNRARQARLNTVLETRNRATRIGIGTKEEIEAARQAPSPSGTRNLSPIVPVDAPATLVPPGGTTAPRDVGRLRSALGGTAQPSVPPPPPAGGAPAFAPGGSIELDTLRPPGPQAMNKFPPMNIAAVKALRRNVRNDGDLKARQFLGHAIDLHVDKTLIGGDVQALNDLVATRDEVNRLAAKTDADSTITRLAYLRPSVNGMANWLVGSTMVNPPIRAKDALLEIKERTKGKPLWGQLRAATLARVMAMQPQDGKPNTLGSMEEVSRFINGRGESLMAVLFSVDERDVMKRIVNNVRMLTNDAGELLPEATPKLRPLFMQLASMVQPKEQAA